jgi:hypothetical protein
MNHWIDVCIALVAVGALGFFLGYVFGWTDKARKP